MPDTSRLRSLVQTHARRLSDATPELDRLISAAAEASFVLIGEASHGTHDFYQLRADLTKRLISEHNFEAVAIEGDWPDAARVHRYVRGQGPDTTPGQALSSFDKFPEWMWRNTVVRDFILWLRGWNAERLRNEPKVGFYGMDLYSLYRSRAEVIWYLESVDADAARAAKQSYSCFDHFEDNPQSYGYTVAFGGRPSCQEEAIQQLMALQSRLPKDGALAEDLRFYAEQNARLVKDAEEYFRTMFAGRVSSWNLRDRHMTDVVDALCNHLARSGRRPKIVIWAHNSHLGDARATEMGRQGEWNVGQLIRERHPNDTFLIGFTTYSGTVMASDDWDSPGYVKRVRPGLPGSYERVFHECGISRFILDLREHKISDSLLERAIGVIYRPETERFSHYFEAQLWAQFDAVIHLDETRSVEPVHLVTPASDTADRTDTVPETFPTGV